MYSCTQLEGPIKVHTVRQTMIVKAKYHASLVVSLCSGTSITNTAKDLARAEVATTITLPDRRK